MFNGTPLEREREMLKATIQAATGAALLLGSFVFPAHAQNADAPATTLFTNVMVFNGSDDQLIDADVLVEGNMIKQVGPDLSASPRAIGALGSQRFLASKLLASQHVDAG